ncbi:MAG: hypothetical protein K0U98_19780 [Deltaproteobacteria bacterium]|nr:hypothetical protein [Deltaproteobacteria bacterium]
MARMFLCALLLLPSTWASAKVDSSLLAGLEARAIGPAAMSGRVATVEVVTADPKTMYVGGATSGVWKSIDGGLTWKPIFDDQPVASIGAISVFQAHPDIVWVGTGEGNPRNSASVGNGIYKSQDGGVTWQHLGLENTERIHRVTLHPTDPEIAYVAALGKTWGEHPQRGIFKTTDGGKIWRKVLYVNETSGGADLVMDPRNPHKLFAALWQHRRWPWSFSSGGPGSGLYSSTDSGESWKKLTPEDGLPKGDLGRIGVAIAPSQPEIVYALVETEKDNVLLRSDDGGKKWSQKASAKDQEIGNRPFYYSDIRVDPANALRIYSLWSLISVSEDGGENWRILVPFAEVHPDHHALWINPNDPLHLLNGNDGGVYESRDRGQTWRFMRNLPFAQFYHLRVDDETPFNVYGGLQDNGSWRGPSTVWENGGIRDHHWQEVNFGDGFDTVPDPLDSSQGYAMSQEGYLVRWSLRTGERKLLRPAQNRDIPPTQEGLRFNWNAGIALDPFHSETVYFGSQFVHRSRDRGDSWEVISDDLTTNNSEWQKQAESGGLTLDVTGAENFTSIVTIAPSPVEPGILWVGTDDGRLHLSRDGGESWESLEGRLKGVPKHTWVPHIEPSRFHGGEAFLVLDDHRRANWTPYVFKTADYGHTWKSLATDNLRGYALSIVQDSVDPELLFLGTEFGLWVSHDGGQHWLPFKHGVPTVSVMDLALQERDGALAIGTHGRGVFILDDLHPFRSLGGQALEQPLHLFEIPAAQQYRIRQTGASRFPGHGEFRGQNQPYGARIHYSMNLPDLPHPDDQQERQRKEDERQRKSSAAKEPNTVPTDENLPESEVEELPKVEIEVSDQENRVIRTFKAPARLGIQRAVWDLRSDPFERPPQDREEDDEDEGTGPEVPPGTYTVTLSFGDFQESQEVEVLADPRFDIAAEDRLARWQALQRAGALRNLVVESIERIHEARADIDTILGKIDRSKKEAALAEGESTVAEASTAEDTPASIHDTLQDSAKELQTQLTSLEKRLWNTPDTKGIPADTAVLSLLGRAQWFLESGWDAPTQTQLAYLERAETLLGEVLEEHNRLFSKGLVDFASQAEEAEIDLLPKRLPLALPAAPAPLP